MIVVKTPLNQPDIKIINQAAIVLKNGGLIVYPTDTAYGLGGNALNENVIKKVYEIKGRGHNKPTHVIVRDWKMIKEISEPNAQARLLFDNFLPGPLTIILNKKNLVPDILTSGLKTLGMRIPDCKVTKLISIQASLPYTTPSANKSGGKTPYSIKEVATELDMEKVDLVIDCGTLPKTKPSTIIDLSRKPLKILRDGPISKNKLTEILNVNIIK
jgi:L-threonylcarbamoyladenylate synthase